MVVANGPIRSFVAGDEPYADKAIDVEAYKNALKESGYTHEEAQRYWNDPSNADPYASAGKEIEALVKYQAPRVSIQDGGIRIDAPKSTWDSPVVNQLKTELQTLKGVNLDNPEVTNAVKALNKEIQENWQNSMVQQTTGWTPEEYKDYQHAVQVVSRPNPLATSDYITGKDLNGKVTKMTVKDWIDYWKKNLNVDQRTDAFIKSYNSTDPYERIMALIMGQGKDRPVYGFDTGERIGQFFAATGNELAKLPVGIMRLFGTDNTTKRAEDIARKTNVPFTSMAKIKAVNEDVFNKKKQDLDGKSWSQLSDDDKAFLVLLGASKEDSMLNPSQREMLKGTKTPTGYRAEDLEKMASEDDDISREAIRDILVENSFDNYKKTQDNFTTWYNYDEDTNQLSKRLEQNAIWSGNEQFAGSMAGTVGRYLWEAALVRAATGGISPKSITNPKLVKGTAGGVNVNAISDKIAGSWNPVTKTGSGILGALGKNGISPASNFGRNVMDFTARLIGTIPEDILQTSIDNTLTYHPEDNRFYDRLDEVPENLVSNFLMMAAANAVGAGWSTVRRARLAKNIEKAKVLTTKLDIPELMTSDIDDFARAAAKNQVKIDGDKVTILDADGKEKVLKNVNGEMAEDGLRKFGIEPEAKAEMEVPKVESPEIGKIQVETETPKGTVMEEVTDYRFKGHEDALKTEIKPTRANIQRWHSRALEAVMRRFDDMMTRFHDKFGDVTVSDFDWVRHQVQQDIPESKILGSTDPSTGRVIDQNKLDAMRWYAEQPEVRDLRKASLNALTNQDSDYNKLGYLPHTDYDPSNLDYDEALTGVLWKKSTGASVMQDGKYVGYGGTFQDRYRTFASNMLWDAKSPDIATSKLVEEAMLDGNELTPELVSEAKKVADGDIKILGIVDKSASTKDIIKNLSSDASEKADFDKIQENTRKDAEKSGLSKAIHDNWTIYRGHNTKNVTSQPKAFATLRFSFDSLCNNLRKIVVDGLGTLYDNGAADMINASGNAYELTMRYAREGGSLKDMLVDYIVNHSHRSAEAASEIADKWITRIGDINGDKTIGNVSIELAKCMYNEGQTRVRRFLSLAKYDQFNSATRNAIDQFLFSKMQTNAIKNSPKITKAVTKALNVATHMRYQALFYGNVKNALLQISELSRLSTAFKWGDIAKMAKRMATDVDFRNRVDIYVDAIAPQTSRLNAELYQKYANVADGMEVKSDGVKFKDITDKMDDIGLAPINAAEAYKNRMMIAALVQEADSKGYTGDAAMRYIRQRFERVALAADEMGKIGITSNPIARVALFLQNFQIRELGMHYYNLLDEAALAKTLPGKLARQIKYVSKVLGSKLAVTLILARLGYSASQTMGFDPFGLMDNYQKLDEDEMNELDKQISNGFLTPLFSGGMTSMIADLYFMSRKAYEDSVRETVSDEAQQNLDKPGFFDSLRFWERTKVPDDALSFDKLMEGAQQFIPGSTAAKRIQQMNEMMDTGWATSATGNKMYTAPEDMLNTLLGYIFGRSATQNAQQYNQTYGDNLWQTLGRFMPGRSWGDFDPIDSENYSDWFKGDENDAQQFNKGIYYFRDRKDEIIDAYEDAMRKSYSSSDDSEAKNNMNQRLDELFNQLEKFVSAYERKHGTITPAMTKQVLNILNIYRKNVGDTADEAAERSREEYNKALERYSALDLPAVGTYTGPTESDATKEVKYQGSPQWRAAVSGYYGTSGEALAVLKEADKVLAPIRKQLKAQISSAYDKKDWDALGRIQKKYLQEFDNVVGPIVASYGNGIFSDTDVVNQLRDMLSTGTNSRSANLIPSEQYAKNKYGKYQSMPYETVDVKKWAQKRFSDKIYTNPTITSNTTAAEDLSEIKKLIRRGQNDLAKARALQLKVRVDNQTRSLSSDDYKWLESYLNYKEGK